MTAHTRGKLMNKFADLIEKNQDEISALEALDNGKPFWMAKGDIALGIKTYRYYAGWCDKIRGETIPIDSSHFCYTRKEPVGVAA